VFDELTHRTRAPAEADEPIRSDAWHDVEAGTGA